MTQSNIPLSLGEQNQVAEMEFVDHKGSTLTLGDAQLGQHKLLFFHSQTCPVCRAMEIYLPNVEKECNSSSFQIVRIDVGRRENQKISDFFQVRVVPTVSLVGPDGQELARSIGYQSEVKLRQGIDMIPKATCAQAQKQPDLSVPFREGESCGSDSNGLTC